MSQVFGDPKRLVNDYMAGSHAIGITNISGPHMLPDWAFMILPELTQGQAEHSLRRKWLRQDPDRQDESEDFSSDLIWQLGYAFAGLRLRGRTLDVTAAESKRIAAHVERFVAMFFSGALNLGFSVSLAIQSISAVALEISVPDDIAERLCANAESLVAADSTRLSDPLFPLENLRDEVNWTVGYALIPGLVKALPHRFDDLVMWLRAGLASGEDLRVRRAMSALHSWVSAPANFALRPPPDGLVREVGVIISSRRRDSLADALSFAEWVFDQGTQAHRDVISMLVVHGLRSLAEEMQYDRHQEDYDVPTIRLNCVRLASSMAKHGFEDHPTIRKWIEIGRDDPFPEVRNAVATSETG